MTLSTVGFVGLGAMGLPMARRLAAAGHAVAVFDADGERVRAFAGETPNVRAATDLTDLAKGAQAIVTMLPNSKVVEAVLFGDGDLVAQVAPGTIFVEMGSGAPGHTVRLAERVAAAGSVMVDAPVSGGVPRAETGELTIMVGGPDAAIDRAEPLLKAMGNAIYRTGAIGTGHAMKALNNLVSAGGFLIGIEALAIGVKFGLEPGLMVDVLNVSTGMNNSTQKKFKQQVLSRAFASGFSMDLLNKDIRTALDVASESGADAPFSALCRDIWAEAQANGVGADHTALARLYEKDGLVLR